jgi:hypothetical protein
MLFVYASFLKIAPDGLRRGVSLAPGAYYCAVHLMILYEVHEIIEVKIPEQSSVERAFRNP